jgi:hypothetical protein
MQASHPIPRRVAHPIPLGLLILPIAAVCAMALGPMRMPEARVLAAAELYAVAADRHRRSDGPEAQRPDPRRDPAPPESPARRHAADRTAASAIPEAPTLPAAEVAAPRTVACPDFFATLCIQDRGPPARA